MCSGGGGRLSIRAAAAAKEINDMEGTGTVKKRVAQDTRLKDEPRSGTPSAMDNEGLLEMVKPQPNTSTHKLLAELGPS